MELPKLAPDWSAVNEFILKTRFRFTDNGDNYACRFGLADPKDKYIPKSEFDSDTLKLLELLNKDVDWFYCNPTGKTLTKQAETLENYLREKYSGLSERSISRISHTYCTDNR